MKIIQITDFHLFSKKQKKLNNVTTYDGFKKTIKYIKKNEKNIDAILVTGDVSEDGSIESYELAIDEIKNFKKNIYFIHGNHDDKKNINMIFYKEKFVKKIEELNHEYWDFIAINTVKEGYDFGFITEKELINIDNKLLISKKFNKKVVLIMHHHPFLVGTPLIDDYILKNGEDLLKKFCEYKNIELIICGHAHGDYQLTYHDVNIEVAPATCFQFKKGTLDVKVETRSGYRIFDFKREYYTSKTIFIF